MPAKDRESAHTMARELTRRRRLGHSITCRCGYEPEVTDSGNVYVGPVDRWGHRDLNDDPCLGSWWVTVTVDA